jgi:hypothetical protein
MPVSSRFASSSARIARAPTGTSSALAQTRQVQPWSLPTSEKPGVQIHGIRRLLDQGVRIGRMASRRASAPNAVATSASG